MEFSLPPLSIYLEDSGARPHILGAVPCQEELTDPENATLVPMLEANWGIPAGIPCAQEQHRPLHGTGSLQQDLRHLLQELRQSAPKGSRGMDADVGDGPLAPHPGMGLDGLPSLWSPRDRRRVSVGGSCGDAAAGDAAGGCDRGSASSSRRSSEKAGPSAALVVPDSAPSQESGPVAGEALGPTALPPAPLSVARPLVPMMRPPGTSLSAVRFSPAETGVSATAADPVSSDASGLTSAAAPREQESADEQAFRASSPETTLTRPGPQSLPSNTQQEMAMAFAKPVNLETAAATSNKKGSLQHWQEHIMQLRESIQQWQERYCALERAARAEICELRAGLQEAHLRLADAHAERAIAAAHEVAIDGTTSSAAPTSDEDAVNIRLTELLHRATGTDRVAICSAVAAAASDEASLAEPTLSRCKDEHIFSKQGLRRRVPEAVTHRLIKHHDEVVRLRCFGAWHAQVLAERRREQAQALNHSWQIESGRDAELVGVLAEHYQVVRQLTERIVDERHRSQCRRLLTGTFSSWRVASADTAAEHRWRESCVRMMLQTELVWHDRILLARCLRAWRGWVHCERRHGQDITTILDFTFKLHRGHEFTARVSFDAWHKISVERCRLMWIFERDASEALREWRCKHAFNTLHSAYLRRLMSPVFSAFIKWMRRLQTLRKNAVCCQPQLVALYGQDSRMSRCWFAWASAVREGMCERLSMCATSACVSLHACRAAFSQRVRMQDAMDAAIVARFCFLSWLKWHRLLKQRGRWAIATIAAQSHRTVARYVLAWSQIIIQRAYRAFRSYHLDGTIDYLMKNHRLATLQTCFAAWLSIVARTASTHHVNSKERLEILRSYFCLRVALQQFQFTAWVCVRAWHRTIVARRQKVAVELVTHSSQRLSTLVLARQLIESWHRLLCVRRRAICRKDSGTLMGVSPLPSLRQDITSLALSIVLAWQRLLMSDRCACLQERLVNVRSYFAFQVTLERLQFSAWVCIRTWHGAIGARKWAAFRELITSRSQHTLALEFSRYFIESWRRLVRRRRRLAASSHSSLGMSEMPLAWLLQEGCDCLSVRILFSWRSLLLIDRAKEAAKRCDRLRGQLVNVQQAADAIREFNQRITLAAALEIWWDTLASHQVACANALPARKPHHSMDLCRQSETGVGLALHNDQSDVSAEVSDARLSTAGDAAISNMLHKTAMYSAAAQVVPQDVPTSASAFVDFSPSAIPLQVAELPKDSTIPSSWSMVESW